MSVIKREQELCGAALYDPALLVQIKEAVLSLEYGSVIISLRGGQVVGLERYEKRRLTSSPLNHSGQTPARPVTRNDF